MAHTLPRFFSQRAESSLRSFSRSHTASGSLRGPALRSQFHSTGRKSVAGGPGGPSPGQEKFKFWPFLAIAAAGSGAYALMVNSRVDQGPPGVGGGMSSSTSSGLLKAPAKDTPTFDPKNVTVLFVLGGPGAGKGTQCANLVKDYGFTHLSAGDLLRAEQDREGSEFGGLIKDCIKNGSIVPMEVTVQLLENAMADTLSKDGGNTKGKKGKFLIDGFPRKMDQAIKFEETVCPAKFVLFFDCPEEEMQKRLLKRGETSGRADDNAESIKKRFKTFVETSMPVVDYFEKEGRVVKVKATKTPEAVYADVQKQIAGKLGKDTLEN